MLSKPEIDCLLNGKEPTQAQVDAIAASLNPSNGVRLMKVGAREDLTFKTLVERLNARNEAESQRKIKDAQTDAKLSAAMEELASQRQEIDELRDHLHQLLARVANKRLKLGK